MEQGKENGEDEWLVSDDTTIYEIDRECYLCMSEKERIAAGLDRWPAFDRKEETE